MEERITTLRVDNIKHNVVTYTLSSTQKVINLSSNILSINTQLLHPPDPSLSEYLIIQSDSIFKNLKPDPDQQIDNIQIFCGGKEPNGLDLFFTSLINLNYNTGLDYIIVTPKLLSNLRWVTDLSLTDYHKFVTWDGECIASLNNNPVFKVSRFDKLM